MPRYSQWQWNYVCNTVFFPNDIKLKYRHKKRIVLAYLHHVNFYGYKISRSGFEDFVMNEWIYYETNNYPNPWNVSDAYGGVPFVEENEEMEQEALYD